MNTQGDRPQNYFSRKRNLDELLHFEDDNSGYIEGKVFMIWPPRNRLHRINLEVVEDSAPYRFGVEVPHKHGVTFRPHERIFLALKGVRVDRRKESSAPHCFPVVLRFPDGVVLKYLSGTNAGRVVDTWEGNTDEWYNPGTVHTVSGAVTLDTSEVYHEPVPTVNCPSAPTVPRTDVASCGGQDARINRSPPLLVPVVDSATTAQRTSAKRPGRSTKASRRRRRLLKEKELALSGQLASDTDKALPAGHATSCHEQPQASIHVSPTKVSESHSLVNGHGEGAASTREGSGISILRESAHNNAGTDPEGAGSLAVRPKAGIRTQRGDVFTALAELQKGHSLINVIGIVASVTSVARTTTNEWRRSIALVDPSTVGLPRQCIKINCFQKKYLEWLPQAQQDDIVILRKLKVVEYNGVVTATGYGDKLRWAVYDPLKHSVRLPNKGNAPEKEMIDDGMGYEYSPYWEPFQDSTELEYCREIAQWWKAKRTFEGQSVSEVVCSGSLPKQHLLISEASPDLPPQGFFNCTVEVLQKFDNHGGATTVYVTDYTSNASVHTVQATWCPPRLSDRVLQCNMWDSAKSIAKMMNPGEYWYLYNIRARWNPSHYMEATMQLAEKVTQLDETKLEIQPHLRALLARKKEFGLNHSNPALGLAPSHTFPEMLLQDVEENMNFLTCVVELLHIDLNLRDGHFLYVTDYTYNPDLPTTISTADWAQNLEHRVVKIKLDDTQAKISSDLRPGTTYIVQNMRIKRPSMSSGIHGCLGGGDTLIVSLRDSSSHHVQTLQRNKEKWKRENSLGAQTMLTNGPHGDELPKRSSTPLGNTTLQEVLAWPAPVEFKVLARATDFFPFSLEDACVLRCTKCDSSPPPSFQRCPRCDDMMETHCKWFYCLYILLQDERGNELIVSLSGKECALLRDVDPVDLRRDRGAYRKFLAKLDPILGNLRDVHQAWSRNDDDVIESPLMAFTLESWNIGNEKGYSLLDCIPCKEDVTRDLHRTISFAE